MTAGSVRADKRQSANPGGPSCALQIGDMILTALGQNPLFISAALPMKVFPPSSTAMAEGSRLALTSTMRFATSGIRTGSSDLSATLFLTPPEEYDGGELVIEDTYGVHKAKLPLGYMVVYPSSSLHRVEPVTQGGGLVRFSGFKAWCER